MNPKTNAPISERTQKYDGIIALSDVTFDKDNLDLYGQDESNYFEGLTKDISENGLINPIVIYDNNECKSGHTRHKATFEGGYTHIPFIKSASEKPEDRYHNMMALMMENMGRPFSITRSFKQVELTCSAFKEKTGSEPTDAVVQFTICPAAQISWNMYSQLKELQLHRPDLFQRVIDSDGGALSPGVAYKLMVQDRKKAKVLPISKILDSMVEKDDVKFAVNSVSNAMSQLPTIEITNRAGIDIPAFGNIQQNILGGLCHEVFVNNITDSINHRVGGGQTDYAVAFPPKAHNDEDIQFKSLNAGIEVKSCMIKGGNKVRFINSKPKTGYYLLTAFSPDYDYAFCAYGYLDAKVWKKAGRGPTQADLSALMNAGLDFKMGELKKDSNSGNVVCYPTKLTVVDARK